MKTKNLQSMAIFGGSFDPIHLGHLHLAEIVREEFKLCEIVFMPSGKPPHKEVSAEEHHNEHRYEMLLAATHSNPHFSVSQLEYGREGYSYTSETLELVRNTLPAGTLLYFILGADALVNMHKWKEPEKIFALCEIIAITRQGVQNETAFEAAEALRANYGAKIHLVGKRTYPTSSTEIRKRVETGLSVKYLVRDEVLEYINTHKLYRKHVDLESIKKFLKENLSPKRYAHSARTALTAIHLAKAHNADPDKAYLAGILHDIAKEMPVSEMQKYRESISYDISSFPDIAHQFIGADLAVEMFGISDRDIISAICYHTTARPCMSALEKIIFIADKIEEGRKYPENGYLMELAKSDLDRAVLEILKITTSIAKSKGKEIHPLSLEVLKNE